MTTIADRIENIKSEFSSCQNWEERYAKIISFGKFMPAMPEQFKSDDNKVKGCQSQVWLFAELAGNNLILHADSDAAIAKGIIALLLKIYSDAPLDEILATKPDFIDALELKQHLSMSRANGLSSMLKQITIYAMAFKAKQQMG